MSSVEFQSKVQQKTLKTIVKATTKTIKANNVDKNAEKLELQYTNI